MTSQPTKPTRPKSPVRWTLLVLLWLWAGCVFMTLDLFRNVPEFDRVRPDWSVYRGMRIAAHRMVGEPLPELDRVRTTVAKDPADLLARRLDAARAATSTAALADLATDADPRVRITALRSLGDRHALLRAIHDGDEFWKVRKAAARLLGRLRAERELETILASELPRAVREGAILGLGEAGTAWSAEQLLAYTTDATYRGAAVQALGRMRNPDAAAILQPAVLESKHATEVRIAICRALARMKASAPTLADVLADKANPAAVRATAADSLGRIGDKRSLTVVAEAVTDPDAFVARRARLAQARLSHVR